MFELFTDLNESSLKQKINEFGKIHTIINIQYSTTPYIFPYFHI
jgi:hypothetical protein